MEILNLKLEHWFLDPLHPMFGHSAGGHNYQQMYIFQCINVLTVILFNNKRVCHGTVTEEVYLNSYIA